MLGFLISADLLVWSEKSCLEKLVCEAWSEKSIEVIRPVEGVQSRATNYILGYSWLLIRSNLLPVCCWHEIRDLLLLHDRINVT